MRRHHIPQHEYIRLKRTAIVNAFRRFFSNDCVRDFEFSDEEINYVSSPKFCEWRNRFLIEHRDEISSVCDAFACVGGDAVQFMKLLPEAHIDVVQVPERTNRLERLRRNIENCEVLNSDTEIHETSIANFLSETTTSHDFIFCDPPWTDAQGNYYSADQMIRFLDRCIATPLRDKYPTYICFKVPFAWDEFDRILDIFPDYELHSSGTFQRHSMHVIGFCV